ncbi:hypothetical protein ACFV4G_41330 [Kitasatospora sp. NPDC059747]|uniref:hypothetical protein n=1 Tax=Kitasatospora sp. NPDC059747 TaxID=3346930 RepID=UPI00364B8F52
MTIQDLLTGVSATDLTAFARSIPTPADFLLTQNILPTVVATEVKWRIRQTSRYVNTAKYCTYDASVPFAERQVGGTSTITCWRSRRWSARAPHPRPMSAA